MSRARAKAIKDTTIWEESVYANTGLSPTLQVSSVVNPITNKREFARTLLEFDIGSITSGINSGNIPNPILDSSISCFLYMFNVPHEKKQATNFVLHVFPITRSWTEDSGLDFDFLTQTGYANAVSADYVNAWSTSGGDYVVDSASAYYNFNHGEENAKIDITEVFNQWLNSTKNNYGLLLKLSDQYESPNDSSSAVSIGVKRFYGRETNTRRAPFIQLEWDGAIKDSRNFVQFNSSGNLYFYNFVNNQLVDINGTSGFPGGVTLSGLSASTWEAIDTNLYASRKDKGIYELNYNNFPLSANVYSAFKDSWSITGSNSGTFTFDFSTINSNNGFDNLLYSKYRVNFRNLYKEYEKGTKSNIRLHIKDDSTIYTPLTAATTAISNYTITEGQYRIIENVTGEIEQDWLDISYDMHGNFFKLDTSNLYSCMDYRIILKLTTKGETIYYDYPERWCFKVL